MIVSLGLLIGITLWLWALFDCVSTPRNRMNLLPKPVWIGVVVLLSWIGAIAWFAFGRQPGATRGQTWRILQPTPREPRPTRPARPSRSPIGPDDDPDFLNRI